jgi:hypothetical protein
LSIVFWVGEADSFNHGPLPSFEEQCEVVTEARRRFDEWLSKELGYPGGEKE